MRRRGRWEVGSVNTARHSSGREQHIELLPKKGVPRYMFVFFDDRVFLQAGQSMKNEQRRNVGNNVAHARQQ